MAGLSSIWQFYDLEKDEYRLPNGRRICGAEARRMEREHKKALDAIKDRLDAKRAYNPYNHFGVRA